MFSSLAIGWKEWGCRRTSGIPKPIPIIGYNILYWVQYYIILGTIILPGEESEGEMGPPMQGCASWSPFPGTKMLSIVYKIFFCLLIWLMMSMIYLATQDRFLSLYMHEWQPKIITKKELTICQRYWNISSYFTILLKTRHMNIIIAS